METFSNWFGVWKWIWLNIGDFVIHFRLHSTLSFPCRVSYVTPCKSYKLEYMCMKAKDILAFIVIVESSQLFGPFPQTVGDHQFQENFGPLCSSSCVTFNTDQSQSPTNHNQKFRHKLCEGTRVQNCCHCSITKLHRLPADEAAKTASNRGRRDAGCRHGVWHSPSLPPGDRATAHNFVSTWKVSHCEPS